MSTIPDNPFDATKPETGNSPPPTTADQRAQHVAGNAAFAAAKTDIGNLETSTAAHYGDASIHFAANTIDHGAIQGLGDDDHPQYHTDARGDARYPPIADTPQINRTDMPAGAVNMAVVASLPGSPDASTLYFVTT